MKVNDYDCFNGHVVDIIRYLFDPPETNQDLHINFSDLIEHSTTEKTEKIVPEDIILFLKSDVCD